MKKVKIGDKEYKFYSFATKYCSHHKGCEEDFPIYDSNVDKMLKIFSKEYHFMELSKDALKDYVFFADVLTKFQEYFKLKDFNFKQIDRYLWQLGKEKKEFEKKQKELEKKQRQLEEQQR